MIVSIVAGWHGQVRGQPIYEVIYAGRTTAHAVNQVAREGGAHTSVVADGGG